MARFVPPLVGQRLHRMATEQPDKPLYTHLGFGDAAPVCLTRAETWRRASALAAVLADRGLRQRPVLLLYEAGPEFGPAFLGTLLAGAIAAPAPVPQFAAQFERLGRIAADCRPGAILTTTALQERLQAKLAAGSELRACAWIATDAMPGEVGFAPPPVAPSDIALLQYTSGSTAEPKGVVLTQANLAHNLDMLASSFQPTIGARIVSWLPHFHDMGLVTGLLAPMTCDGESILMAPRAFLLRPRRWLEAISDYQAEISGAPNFAYDLCTRSAEKAGDAALDLRSWRSAFAGAEPIRMATLGAFAERFAADGFARNALTPCYGMAEATLMVACKPARAEPAAYLLDRDAAREGRAEPAEDPATGLLLTGCGHPAQGTRLRIVDPVTRTSLPPRRIGEIWIAGPQVARGYWNRQGEDNPFGARLDDAGSDWLRTGDLGFLADDGELVFVDRLKDLIIIHGQNYPCHDLELTAAESHAAVAADACMALRVDEDGQPHIAILAELAPAALAGAEQVAAAIRARLFSTHALAVRTVVFVAPRRLSRTTSGKLQRRLTAQRLADRTLLPLAQYGDPLPTMPPIPARDDARP